uniref:Uncharacterized protein n=1 Tax=Physcomitrium patens TaxID=3218 RepID=A0A2K1JUU0_PHYPA|nr:hypothetical protein PHYPA_015061 [Physcomitrium patens]
MITCGWLRSLLAESTLSYHPLPNRSIHTSFHHFFARLISHSDVNVLFNHISPHQCVSVATTRFARSSTNLFAEKSLAVKSLEPATNQQLPEHHSI